MKKYLAVLLVIVMCMGVMVSCTKEVASLENVEVDNKMFTYFLNIEITSAYNNALYYAQMYGLGEEYASYFLGYDPGIDLKDQAHPDGGTWYDYYVNLAKKSMIEVMIYANAAKEAGLKIDQSEIDAEIEEIKKQLKETKSKFSDMYGKGVGEDDVRRCLELSKYAMKFLEYKQDDIESELENNGIDTILKYVDDHKEDFYFATVLKHTETLKENKFVSAKAFDDKVEAEKRFAKMLEEAHDAYAFLDLLENRNNIIRELVGEIERENDTDMDDYAEDGIYSGMGNETIAETEMSSEDLDALIEKYDEIIKYSEETDLEGNRSELNEWLFGDEGAKEGEILVIETEGTETERVHNSEKETTTTEKAEDDTSEEDDGYRTDGKSKTYRVYTISTYYVMKPCDLDHEYTHNFGYLVVSDKAIAEAVKSEITEKSLDAFYRLAHKKRNEMHGSVTYDYNKVECITAEAFEGAYGAKFRVVDDWIESPDRRSGDISDIFEIVEATGFGKDQKERKIYVLIYFDKENTGISGESWYPDALSATVSDELEKWYKAQPKPEISDSELEDIPVVKFASSNGDKEVTSNKVTFLPGGQTTVIVGDGSEQSKTEQHFVTITPSDGVTAVPGGVKHYYFVDGEWSEKPSYAIGGN